MAMTEADVLSHPAVAALVMRLEARISELEAALTAALARVADLEAQHGGPAKTAANSSLPPSSGFKADRSARRRAARAEGEPAAKRGPKPGHRGVSRSRVPAAMEIVLSAVHAEAWSDAARLLTPRIIAGWRLSATGMPRREPAPTCCADPIISIAT